jgi:hypothetical protein
MGNNVRIGMEASSSDSQTNTQVVYCAHEADVFQNIQLNQATLVNVVKLIKEDQGDTVLRIGEDDAVLSPHLTDYRPIPVIINGTLTLNNGITVGNELSISKAN